jgi:hypothetical protein
MSWARPLHLHGLPVQGTRSPSGAQQLRETLADQGDARHGFAVEKVLLAALQQMLPSCSQRRMGLRSSAPAEGLVPSAGLSLA